MAEFDTQGPPWLCELLSALGWDFGTIYQAIDAVRVMRADIERRARFVPGINGGNVYATPLDRLKSITAYAETADDDSDTMIYFSKRDGEDLRACVDEIERLRGVEQVDRRMCQVQLDMRDEINALRCDIAVLTERLRVGDSDKGHNP